MIRPLSMQNDGTIQVKSEVLIKLLEFSEALLKGDYTRRVITDFSDDLITKISNTFNRYADKMQLDPTGSNCDQDQTVNMFMDVIGSYTNLDFKQKLTISENGTIWDAIATGINMLWDELEQSTTSRQELERYKFLAKQKGLSFTYEIDESVPAEVIGDQVRISQIVNNLISNALKFTNEGGIDVKFSAEKKNDNEILIQGIIKDTGIGIAKEAQGRIFQSFDQADNSVTRKYGGTGLGLSIVKSLAELMNGTIAVQSPANKVLNNGSCFTFTLRLKVLEKEVKHRVAAKNGKTLKNQMRVLIVDDNPINLIVARKMVEGF